MCSCVEILPLTSWGMAVTIPIFRQSVPAFLQTGNQHQEASLKCQNGISSQARPHAAGKPAETHRHLLMVRLQIRIRPVGVNIVLSKSLRTPSMAELRRRLLRG